jgi:hypothetical protein
MSAKVAVQPAQVWTAIAVIGLAMLAATTGARANPGLENLVGAWSGSGRLNYSDGSSEGIRCNAYYTLHGGAFSLAIQCRSDKNPIHIRSKLNISGNRLSGAWEERTFNASGKATGTVSGQRIDLNVGGGGFTGSMTVSIGRSTHRVRIETQGIAISRATIELRKSGR